MAEFIKPIDFIRIRSAYGYSVVLRKKNRLNKIEKELNLGSVLDLSYSRREQLAKFLEDFLEDQATIMLDEALVLEDRIEYYQKCIQHDEAVIKGHQEALAEVEKRLKELKND